MSASDVSKHILPEEFQIRRASILAKIRPSSLNPTERHTYILIGGESMCGPELVSDGSILQAEDLTAQLVGELLGATPVGKVRHGK